MAWTTISNALVAVGAKPFATTIQALRDNVIALAAQDAGAPKIRQVNTISGAEAATQTFTGLDDYEGVEFSIAAVRGSGSSALLVNYTLEYSTNGGSSWSSASTLIASVGNPSSHFGSGAFDFATGGFSFVGSRLDGNLNIRASGTIAGASLSIDALRFSFGGFGLGIVIIRPKGATV